MKYDYDFILEIIKNELENEKGMSLTRNELAIMERCFLFGLTYGDKVNYQDKIDKYAIKLSN